jgi:tetratricopeptide (TPR) repeat protein
MEVEPKLYRAIMVSSTFTDLEAHRREVIDAIHRFGFHANVMEYSGARSDSDVIDTSLRMVRESVAYLCVIGHKYGQTPVDADRNPAGLSITELEFNEARRLGRPILLFLMADDHPVTKGDVEPDSKKRRKLEAFRKQAKRVDPGKPTERVYETFASEADFAKKTAIAVGLQAIRMARGSDLPDRAVRDAIANFIDVKPDAKQAELTDAIERFETDYRALQRQLAAISVSDNRVTSLKADAEAALAEGDLDKARAAYREAAEAARDKAAEPVRTAAELKSAEAGAHLLALDWQAADIAWAEAAAMLAPFDRGAADEFAEDAAERLTKHGELYARAGALTAAIERWRGLAMSAQVRGDEREAARFHDNLGTALSIQGARVGDPEGLRLLDEAAAAYRDALAVDDEPANTAATQNNLGIVLTTQGVRRGGAECLLLFGQAVTVFRHLLTVYSRTNQRAEWAMTQNNLGNALMRQGQQTGGDEGLLLLEAAVSAYREAMAVYNRTDTPDDWAKMQNNLGTALASQGAESVGPESIRLLEQAVTAFRLALTVRTRGEMPANWAMTQENIGLVLETIAEIDTDHALAHLHEAEAALVAALSVYTSEDMAFHYEKATGSLVRVRAKLAALDA